MASHAGVTESCLRVPETDYVLQLKQRESCCVEGITAGNG